MCRFAAYIGTDIFISSLVTEPKHSLIHQSYHAKEREEPLNGDGFGIGWYTPQISDQPALFKDIAPAWSNRNLRDIARVTKSHCIFAHVRAATIGGISSYSNCHPFAWRQFIFMHNGTIFGFDRIMRSLRRDLSEEAYSVIKGSTDTEHIFALLIDEIHKLEKITTSGLSDALRKTILRVEELKVNASVLTPSTMNLVLSDGKRMIATRYISSGENSNSLYVSAIDNYSCTDGQCMMDHGNKAYLIVSEPLTSSDVWQKVENNTLVSIDSGKKLQFEKFATL